MIDLSIATEYRAKWPDMKLACLECELTVVEDNALLWALIEEHSARLRRDLKMEAISKLPAIAASRKGYKALGKDPARYRLSAEALMRRVVKGNDLYQINNVVDVVNLASINGGFSIGGYDVEHIVGPVKLGIGQADETYAGIGRGALNIEFLTVLRDGKGAFGSPTSDSLRTSVTFSTTRFMMVYFGFGAHDMLEAELDFAQDLLLRFANAKSIERYTM
jgi:DNA/RNA-binding domain of Phe-tRNA-synthetase-like protein